MQKITGLLLIVAAIVLLARAFISESTNPASLQVVCPQEYVKLFRLAGKKFQKEVGVQVSISATTEISQADLIIDFEPAVSALKQEAKVKEVIPVAKTDQSQTIQVAVTSECKQPIEALKFARFMAAPETGSTVTKATRLIHLAGDTWEEKPELILYSGGVNRPAVEELLKEFADREGVELTTVFNGCGILCAAMQTMTDSESPRFPDAYFACDLCFVPPVAEHFSEVVLLTETDIGIAIPKGNPHQIKTLVDLAKPGLKIGLCNQKQSTLGYMTDGILKSSGLATSIRKNMAVEVPTADFLITQLRSGALDAAIVYRVNAELQKQDVEFIKINHEGARAVQPFSVRGDSKKSQLAKRLQDHFLANPHAFEETGFTWRGDQGVLKSSQIEIPEWLRKSK